MECYMHTGNFSDHIRRRQLNLLFFHFNKISSSFYGNKKAVVLILHEYICISYMKLGLLKKIVTHIFL